MTLARALVATPEAATVAAIRAALDDGPPLGLIATRTDDGERAALRARLAATPVPADTAFVVFTSGSTGRPKGVVVSRSAARGAAAASAAHLGWRDDDTWLIALPLGHVGGLAALVRSLLAGRPWVFDDARGLARPEVTLASLVPTQLEQLLADPAWRPSPRLRAVLLGGAAAAPSLVAAARARGVPVLTTYGMTETFGQVATADATTPLGAIGAPLPGVSIVGGTAEAPAPLTIGSPGLMTGYLDDPTPSLAGGFVTRDLGHVVDGQVYVVGRVDDVIITGGENVYPIAIEARLTALPLVRAAAVAAVPDPVWGERVGALVVLAPGATLAQLEAATAGWPAHQRPRVLAAVDALPLAPSSKLDRAAVARYLCDQASRGSSARTPNAAR